VISEKKVRLCWIQICLRNLRRFVTENLQYFIQKVVENKNKICWGWVGQNELIWYPVFIHVQLVIIQIWKSKYISYEFTKYFQTSNFKLKKMVQKLQAS